MKRSEEILGLSIISIGDGREVGRVKDLVVNPEQGAVECLVVENGNRHLGVKVIPFKDVEGIGEYAVTVANDTTIVELDEVPHVSNLLERNVQVKGTKVLTRKGNFIGEVTEYIVDEDNNGKIVGCQLAARDDSLNNKYIPKDSVVTFGKDVLVVVEGVADTLADNIIVEDVSVTDSAETKETATKSTETTETPTTPPDAAQLFEQRQRQFMLGRQVAKQIVDSDGQVLAEEGETITEELMDRVKDGGKWSELVMNTKSN
ncbi:MAG: PRC-barrel domain-containing protein [Clostridia bacterium]|nr:PRC-barrel domain-containing protein [Clostridia bacterium]